MINKIKEIYKCLELGLYESALTLTLVLPEMCEIAENNKNSKDGFNYFSKSDEYINWVENNIPIFEMAKGNDYKIFIENDKLVGVGFENEDEIVGNVQIITIPQINGNLCWCLRCALLHLGIENFTKTKAYKNYAQNESFFERIKEIKLGVTKDTKYKDFAPLSVYCNDKGLFTFYIDIELFCKQICKAVEGYYEKNKNIFDKNLRLNIEDFSDMAYNSYLEYKTTT